jgi:hypothetical protein
MDCPLSLDKVHCQNCYWLVCKLNFIKAVEEHRDEHGNIRIDAREWEGLIQAGDGSGRLR